jgi:hypothetical protein
MKINWIRFMWHYSTSLRDNFLLLSVTGLCSNYSYIDMKAIIFLFSHQRLGLNHRSRGYKSFFHLVCGHPKPLFPVSVCSMASHDLLCREIQCTYTRCRKWCPPASILIWTRLISIANTFCRSVFGMFLLYSVTAVLYLLSVRGRSRYTDNPIYLP